MGGFVNGMGVGVEVLRGKVKGKGGEGIVGELLRGDVDMVIGRDGVIEERVKLCCLGVVVIEEEEGFGVGEGGKLWGKKRGGGDVLVMRGSGIGGRVGMSLYGEVDVWVIDELGGGGKGIERIDEFEKGGKRM